MDISLQLFMLLWISIWISLDFYGYPCIMTCYGFSIYGQQAGQWHFVSLLFGIRSVSHELAQDTVGVGLRRNFIESCSSFRRFFCFFAFFMDGTKSLPRVLRGLSQDVFGGVETVPLNINNSSLTVTRRLFNKGLGNLGRDRQRSVRQGQKVRGLEKWGGWERLGRWLGPAGEGVHA